MSYSFTVTVKDGTASIDTAGYAAPPDGKYTVNGHYPAEGTWQAEQIKVTRFTPDSQIAIQAEGIHYV